MSNGHTASTQVFLVWDAAANRDVAWLTLLDQEDFPGVTRSATDILY